MDSEKLEQLNAQLKREWNIERGPVSASANAWVNLYSTTNLYSVYCVDSALKVNTTNSLKYVPF